MSWPQEIFISPLYVGYAGTALQRTLCMFAYSAWWRSAGECWFQHILAFEYQQLWILYCNPTSYLWQKIALSAVSQAEHVCGSTWLSQWQNFAFDGTDLCKVAVPYRDPLDWRLIASQHYLVFCCFVCACLSCNVKCYRMFRFLIYILDSCCQVYQERERERKRVILSLMHLAYWSKANQAIL